MGSAPKSSLFEHRYDPQAFKFDKMKEEVAHALKEDWKRVLLPWITTGVLAPKSQRCQDTIDDAKKRAITTTASYDESGPLTSCSSELCPLNCKTFPRHSQSHQSPSQSFQGSNLVSLAAC